MNELERDQLPDLSVTADEQQAQQALAEEPHDVRGDHHLLPRQPVGPDAAGEKEQHLAQNPGEEDEPEVGNGAGQIEDRECDRDRDEEVAYSRDQLRPEDAAKVAQAQDFRHHPRVKLHGGPEKQAVGPR